MPINQTANINELERLYDYSISHSTDLEIPADCDSIPVEQDGDTYTFTYTIPSNEWCIRHDLNRFPSITLVDDNNQVVLADIIYLNSNYAKASFTAAYTGKAYVN